MPLCTDICTTTVSIDYDVSRATEHRSSFTFALHDLPLRRQLVYVHFVFNLIFHRTFFTLSVYLYSDNIEKYRPLIRHFLH